MFAHSLAREVPVEVQCRGSDDPAEWRFFIGFSTHPGPSFSRERHMWTKPEFEVVEVTMEVTAYVARR
jgi:coenzyme PQQ precursor peptide PqqA